MTEVPSHNKRYRVKLGLTEVTVECNSKEEALRLARIRLTDEMPRFYDLILRGEDERFEVNEVPDDSSP